MRQSEDLTLGTAPNVRSGVRVIGVTGGVGAGKSEVLDYLKRRWGASVLKLDDVSRELLSDGGACVEDTIRLFGDGICGADGRIDRGRIAAVIFSDEGMREKLNAIIHPKVREEMRRFIEAERARGVRLIVIETALPVEGQLSAVCDEVWYIYADEAVRAERLAAARGYDAQRIRGTMEGQLREEAFRAYADRTIDNSGAFSDTCAAIDSLLK